MSPHGVDDRFVDPLQDERHCAHEGWPQHVGVTLGAGLHLGALVGQGEWGGVTDPDTVQQARRLGKQLQHVSQGQVADVSRSQDKTLVIAWCVNFL